ncbi:MAG: hypothetical protein H6865_04935 [Rhodospirillales bacterium]|nr:hypothetical protein [Alphaproteobacteria bacterium]MCB9986963.1 hypothetical protein [Rhodospirillales bacterium]USO08262.1 MAG: hypothetical protein H6866_03355 [Rhodospirillales bacterium]
MPYPNHPHGHGRPQANAPRWTTIYPGSVLWIEHMLQTLTPARQILETGQATKPRPVVALKKTVVRVDADNICLDDAFMQAVCATTQDFLAQGRPGVQMKISPQSTKTSYFQFDSLASVALRGERMRVVCNMDGQQRKDLAAGLDVVLKPEKRFFLKSLFNERRGCLPGHVWTIEIPNPDPEGPLTCEADAVVLLRRGRFFLNEAENGATHYTPYTVAVLPDRFRAQDMRGLTWNRVRLMPVHENAFRYQVGQLTDETVSILLNSLRRELSLPAIQYERPLIRHIIQWLHPFTALALPRPGGM